MNNHPREAVLFTVSGQMFAIEAAHVSEFLWLPALNFLDEQPGYVRGAFELRGELVLAVDLNLRFGHPTQPLTAEQGVIITRTAHGIFAIIIDELLEFGKIALLGQLEHQHKPRHALQHNPFITAEFTHNERLGALLDLAELLPDEPPAFDALIARVDPMADVPRTVATRLNERRAQYRKAETEDTDDVSRAVVVVQLSGEQFAFGLQSVKEFAYLGRVYALVGAPPHVRGNINLRGEIVTVFDVSAFLGLPPVSTKPNSPVVIFRHGQELAAFVVDELVDIVSLDMEKIGPLPIGIPKPSRPFLEGEYRFQDRPLTIVDVKKMLSSDLLLVNQ